MVLIDGDAAPQTVYKAAGKVMAKGGAALKAQVPKGVTVRVAVRDLDGRTSASFPFVR